jgi:hypothetical protein
MGIRSFGMGSLFGSSGMGYGGVTMCDPKDDGFFCKLNRFTSEIQMLLFIVMLVAIPGYLLWKRKYGKFKLN